MTCRDQCPICKTALVDQCCETCGSLEGVDEDCFAASRVFGYDWAGGSVAPWRDASGHAYATPAELAEVALTAAGLRRGGYVIDLGCGDAAILRTAATRYGCHGLGLDIDDGALADAARAIETDGVSELVSVRRADLREFDLAGEVEAHAGPVVVTCYLLPATLRELRPKLEDAVARGATIILFRWDCGLAWRGPPGHRDDRGYTVYRPVDGGDSDETDSDPLSSLVDMLGFEALHNLDAESLVRLGVCARKFGFANWRRDEAAPRGPLREPLPAPRGPAAPRGHETQNEAAEIRQSFCENVAWRRLRADKRFRDYRTGKMPGGPFNVDGRLEWGRTSASQWDGDLFLGWMHLLRDWEWALEFERRNRSQYPLHAYKHPRLFTGYQRMNLAFVYTPEEARRQADMEAAALDWRPGRLTPIWDD